ncbi:MAG: Hpt domain-containing protein [Planctomycetota bacterium]
MPEDFEDEDFQEIVDDFLVESREMVESLERDFVALEGNPRDLDLLNSAFRAIHTIKGTSDFLHFSTLTGLAHALEDVLDPLRSGDLSLSPEIMDHILEGVDGVRVLLDDIEAKREHGLDVLGLSATLRSHLSAIGGSAPEKEKTSPAAKGPPIPPDGFPAGLDEEVFVEIFHDFVSETREKFPLSRTSLETLSGARADRKDVEHLYRFMHTLKGTARFLKLGALGELGAASESLLDTLKGAGLPLPLGVT